MKNFKTVSHALFDMDGLLLDTEIMYTRVTQKIVARFGKTYDWSIKANMIGLPAARSSQYLVDTLELPITAQEYLDERNSMLIEAFPQCGPLPGAVKLITHLHEKGIPIAVATSSSRELFEVKTKNHQSWFSLFNTVVTPESPGVRNGKPAADIFLVAAAELGAQAQDCIVFEDAPSGLAAAKSAAMQAVVVPDANMDKSRYAEADLILESLEQFKPEDFGLPAFA